MSQSFSCPVCGRQGLPADCARCPQCDSDLTCFQVLDSLSLSKAAPDSVSAKQTSRRFPWLAIFSGAALVLLLALLAAGWKSGMPGLHHKLTAFFAPDKKMAQDQKIALHEAGGKIHIDAQIRILDDRQKREGPPASQSASPDEKKQAEESVQKKARQVSDKPPVAKAPPDATAVAQAAAPEQTKASPEDSSIPDSPSVELSEPVVKKAVAAAPLPVLQGRRKRAVRTISVSGLRQVDADYAKNKNKSNMVHHAQDGETVWELAERFYGEGKYYPVIMELNPQILQGCVRGGGKVRLLADRRQAAALYQRSTEQRDGLLLWKHKVQPGETWQSLYARFFPPKYSGMVFYPGGQKVVPGSTVRIILR